MNTHRGGTEILADDDTRDTLILERPTAEELTSHLCAILMKQAPSEVMCERGPWEQTSYFTPYSEEFVAQRALNKRIQKDPTLQVQKVCKILTSGSYDGVGVITYNKDNSKYTRYMLEIFQSHNVQPSYELIDRYDRMVAEIGQVEHGLIFTGNQIRVCPPDNEDPFSRIVERAHSLENDGVRTNVVLFASL